MKPTIYIETSVISYLVAKPSRDIVVAANQQVTREWWENCLDDYEAVVSETVVREISAGDAIYAQKRINSINRFAILEMNSDIQTFADYLIQSTSLTLKAERDAFHIAFATHYNIDYLATWNCTHIANAHIRKEITGKCVRYGYTMPTICTPLELLGGEDHVERPNS